MKYTPKQIENSCVRLICGEETGSGFFISEDVILTARHVVSDYETNQVTVDFFPKGAKTSVQIQAEVLAEDWNLDIAILKIASGDKPKCQLTIVQSLMRYHERWDTFGYPFANLNNGQRFYGKIIGFNHHSEYDLLLNCKDIEPNYDYSGLSGSPLVCADGVCGLITWSTVFGLGAISSRKLAEFFETNGVQISYQFSRYDFPEEFEVELNRTEANVDVFNELDKKIQIQGSYCLLQGSPGSGKSVIAAKYSPEIDGYDVVGRYLIRMTGDTQPVASKVSKENLLLWFEDLVQQTLFGEITPNMSLGSEDRIARLALWFNDISEFYRNKGLIGVFFIDGLDEIMLQGIVSTADFLSIFPEKLPQNLRVIFSCTSESILPPRLRANVAASTINVTPLDKTACFSYLKRELSGYEIDLQSSQLTDLVQKSEGHPLYLRYLTEILLNHVPENFEAWISTLPTIDGDIGRYYEVIWNSLVLTDADRYWICLTAAHLRQPVIIDRFVEMLPDTAQYSFSVKFPSFRHLFKNSHEISLHHSSFTLFISNKSSEKEIRNVHDNISKSNLQQPDDEYSVYNLIHHFLRSNSNEKAISHCEQAWADKCAKQHMHPDLIIDDIKEVEALTLCLSDLPSFVEIKLLLNRIDFRYDHVLAKHAFEIANALIELGRPQHALKYMLRRGLLLISFDDAILFLQKLYESGAMVEAKQLYSAVETRVVNAIESSNKENKYNISAMIQQMQLLTLGSNHLGPMVVGNSFVEFMQLLVELIDQQKDQEAIDNLQGVKEYVFSWFMGYNLYRYHKYPRIAEITKNMGIELTGDWIRSLSKVSINYFHFMSNKMEINDNYKYLTEDIEYLIENFGYEQGEEKMILGALIEESTRPDLLSPIAAQISIYEGTFTIRAANGVDANYISINDCINSNMFKGYSSVSPVFESLPKFTPLNWEFFLEAVIRKTAYLFGVVLRSRAEQKGESLSNIHYELEKVLTAMSFTLSERISWDRSYGLIEAVCPKIYGCLGDLYIRFLPDRLDVFLAQLKKRSSDQLGLYTEGFRKVLFNLIDQLIDYGKFDEAFSFLQILEAHLEEASQNRWERTPDLLKLVSQYGRIDNQTRADAVYQKMLDSSMGPSWYKEGQLGLISTTTRYCWVPDCGYSILRDFASYLDYASGELTFQRFVQQSMNSFGGILASRENVSKGIDYIKCTVLPTPEEIFNNAHSSTIDVPVVGDGYILGANQLIIGSAVVSLLENIPDIDPVLALAISKAYIVNDDTERYLSDFIEIICRSLSNEFATSEENGNALIEEIVDLVSSDELEVLQHSCISTFFRELDEPIFGLLKVKLLEAGFDKSLFDLKKKETEPRVYNEEHDDLFQMPGVGKISNLSKIGGFIENINEALGKSDKATAANMITECFRMLSEGGADIWMGKSLSTDNEKLFNILIDNFELSEVLRITKEFILDHDTENWSVVAFLIRRFGAKLDFESKKKVLGAIAIHIETMIQSKGKFHDKYKWLLDSEQPSDDSNQLLESFLIWSLNYPSEKIKLTVMESIIWYAQKRPEIIRLLHSEAMKEQGLYSSELSAFIIKQLSYVIPEKLRDYIFDDEKMSAQVAGQKHFMIRAYYYEILLELYPESDSKLPIINLLFMPGTFSGSEVVMDDNIQATTDLIEDLNLESVLNKEFCKSFYSMVDDLAKPLRVAEQQDVERYVRRSFFNEEIEIGSYEFLERYAINLALSKNVYVNQLDDIKEIMELPMLKYDY